MSRLPEKLADGETDLTGLLLPLATRLGSAMDGAMDGARAVQELALGAACGRILARDSIAPFDLPAFDVAAMDGYALRSTDLREGGQRLPVHGLLLAGQAAGELPAGHCVRIMTGAPVPAGADAIVLLEEVAVPGTARDIPVQGPLAPGRHIRPRGEHVRAGEAVLLAGRCLQPEDIGLLAAMGIARVAVRARLRVGVLSTGDELCDAQCATADPGPGRIFDSNRPMILAALGHPALETVDLGICPDQPAALAAVLERACGLGLSALLVSGGAAQGDADSLRRVPGLQFMPVPLRPGRGILAGRVGGAGGPLLLGLPGNGVAAHILLHLLAIPLLQSMAGGVLRAPRVQWARLTAPAQVRAGTIDLRRARLLGSAQAQGDTLPCVELLSRQGSAMLRTLSEATVLAALGPQDTYRAGDTVAVLPLPGLAGTGFSR
jgi:molybdopterin molybdotransferase